MMIGTRDRRADLAAHVDARDLGQHHVEQHQRGLRSRRSARAPRRRRPRSRRGSPRVRARPSSASRYDCSSSTTRMSGGSAISAALRRGSRRATAAVRDRQARGVNVEPSPSRDSTVTSPPCAWATWRTIASPSPVPPVVAAPGPVDAVEPLEDPFEVARRDARCRGRARRPRRESPSIAAHRPRPAARRSEYLIALSSRLVSALTHLAAVARDRDRRGSRPRRGAGCRPPRRPACTALDGLGRSARRPGSARGSAPPGPRSG